MDAIIVRCKMCKHAMKFSAEKAGKRAKCPKCDAIVLVEADGAHARTEEPAPEVAAAPLVKAVDDEDDPTGGYDVFTDPEMEEIKKRREAEEEAAGKKRKERKKLPKMLRKTKAIPDAESWTKVRFGLLFTFIGVWIWIFTHLAQGSYVVLGKVEFPEYANMIAVNLEARGGDEDFPARGKFWDVDEVNVYLGMIAGRDILGYARAMLTMASLFYFLQAFAWGIGYVFSLPVPRRFGMFGQVIASMVLAFFNFLIMFFFKLLPVLGVFTYVMIPFITPEIVLTEYNIERTLPIHVLWSAAPFWENLLNVIFKFLFYLQPTFGCIFIWSIGLAIKHEKVEQRARGLTQMSLGVFFILFCFHMLSLCGSSPVMVNVLRVFYTVWFCFLFLFMLQYASLILKCRAVLFDKINPRNELEE
jgi:hypothetical protein